MFDVTWRQEPIPEPATNGFAVYGWQVPSIRFGYLHFHTSISTNICQPQDAGYVSILWVSGGFG